MIFCKKPSVFSFEKYSIDFFSVSKFLINSMFFGWQEISFFENENDDKSKN